MRLNSLVPDILFESVGHFLWDEYVLPLFLAFGVSERQLSVLDVSGSQLQDFTDSHSASGHQFQDEAVSWFVCLEDDFVDNFLFDDFPGGNGFCLEHLSQDWGVAGVMEILIDIGFDEVEES